MKILYLLHAPFELPGLIESWAAEKGYEQTYCSPYAGEAIPKRAFDLIVVMGGPQSAVDLDADPYLHDEAALIRLALKAKVPVLGFCLGAQLIGSALGAPAERSPNKEVGVFPITLTEHGKKDPLLAGIPQRFPVTHWHNDMPGLTKEAVVLATSAGCPRQIVRYASHAYGFQCHPEMTLQGIQGMITNCPNDFSPAKFVQSPKELLAHDYQAMNHQNMQRILENFLKIVSGRTKSTRVV